MKTPYNQAINLEGIMGTTEKKWMTKTGAFTIALSTILPAMLGLGFEFAESLTHIMQGVGGMLTFIGLGRKLDRIK